MSKKLYDLQIKRVDLVDKMEKIVSSGNISDADQRSFDRMKLEVGYLDEEITREQHSEMVNKSQMKSLNINSNDTVEQFRSWIENSLKANGSTQPTAFTLPISERANPIVTSTDSGIINKTVANITALYSPNEQMLRDLGVVFHTNLNGNLVLPILQQSTAGWVNETADGSTANLTPTSLTLSPKRVVHSQKITREALVSTNAGTVNSIIENLYRGIWNAVAEKFFDELQADTPGQVMTANATSLSNQVIVNLEASLGSLELIRPGYVTTPQVRAYLKNTAKLANGDAIWGNDNIVNGYSAYGSPAANTSKLYFGDWAQTVIGQWNDGLEVIMDPYTQAASGQVNITVTGLFDVGCFNKYGFVTADVSAN